MSKMPGTANATTVATPGTKLCRNGLHEIDETWTPPPGQPGRRCRECWKARCARHNEKRTVSGKGAKWQRELRLRSGRDLIAEGWNGSPRHRAQQLCRKYGVSLNFYDDLGWYPPDVATALQGGN